MGRVKRPKFYEYFEPFNTPPRTSRVCSHAGCEELAPFIDGHYVVSNKRVRVWVCAKHKVGSPNTVLPMPANIKYAEEQEALYLADVQHSLRFVVTQSRSIKTLAASGHGEPIRGDRVAAWRWGEI